MSEYGSSAAGMRLLLLLIMTWSLASSGSDELYLCASPAARPSFRPSPRPTTSSPKPTVRPSSTSAKPTLREPSAKTPSVRPSTSPKPSLRPVSSGRPSLRPTPSPSRLPSAKPSLRPQPIPTASPQATSGQAAVVTTISVRFHVISSSTGRGNPSDKAVRDQIDVLNRDYYGTGFNFTLTATDRVVNDLWHAMAVDSTEEIAAKQALSFARVNTLNVYSIGPSGNVGGWSTFPWGFSSNPKKDGVVIVFNTLPGYGGTGVILTHEVGHWLGLYHTFLGGCKGDGDFVSDTPAEANPATGCNEIADTCSDSAGTDPVHNFMDYSSCRNSFTAGQVKRMRDAWSSYRA